MINASNIQHVFAGCSTISAEVDKIEREDSDLKAVDAEVNKIVPVDRSKECSDVSLFITIPGILFWCTLCLAFIGGSLFLICRKK